MLQKTTCLIALFMVSWCLSAQEVLQFSETLTWTATTKQIPNPTNARQLLPIQVFEQADFNIAKHPFPIYGKKVKLSATGNTQVLLQEVKYEPYVAEGIADFNEYISGDIAINKQISYEKKQAYALINFIPIRQNKLTGAYEKIVSFNLVVRTKPTFPNNTVTHHLTKSNKRTYAENSVLATGDFYKISVTENGIHKITADFVNGLSPATPVSIENIRVYGNGGGLLPELAGGKKFDDLVENPIKVFDENNNGEFDGTDYLLFYAAGPNQWKYDYQEKRFKHQMHFYSETAHYFLNFDKGQGKRITSVANNNTPTITINTFNDYAIYEKEYTNFLQTGRRWYAEDFNVVLTRDYDFNFPNLVSSEPVKVATSVVARSLTTSSSFSVLANQQPLHQHNNLARVRAGYDQPYGKSGTKVSEFSSDKDLVTINLTYQQPDPTATGWVDYITVEATRQLTFVSGQLAFRSIASVGENAVAKFEIGNGTNIEVWDITNISEVTQMNLTNANGTPSFVQNTDTIRKFIAFDGTEYKEPVAVGKIDNQNLHAVNFPDMLIITHPDFLAQAEQLAVFHAERDNLETNIVTPQQIYQEFSSGTPDISAIRDYVKMFYDRAGTDVNLLPQYLLLFGDASFDYKNIRFKEETNQNLIPTYESWESVSAAQSYATDDFFGFLDDNEGDNIEVQFPLLDIGIGRLPVRTVQEAQTMIDKIKHYADTGKSLGEWRNQLTFIADDEDGNLHLNDAESHTDKIENRYPTYNVDKIYLDAYTQEPTAGGSRYPDVNKAINATIFSGSMLMNYVGHGGEKSWAHESIFNINDIPQWDNLDRMPLFITATCSFSRYDNPAITSAGEALILYEKGGAIALMSTVRLVYASSNLKLNGAFLNHLFEPDNGTIPRLGEIARRGKNEVSASTNAVNNRKFILLGDPALRLGYPTHKVATTSISQDTIKALSKVTVEGEVQDKSGVLLADFNGTIYPTIYDKVSKISTQGNDEKSYPQEFSLRKNIIFKGKASVTNGRFSFSFIVPKDISYNFGQGRISYYAENGITDAHGYSEDVIIGGIDDQTVTDNNGPDIEVFMDSENFVFGGLTSKNPLLIVRLKDENGINTVGNGIGHDITGTIDEASQNSFTLNQYYKATLDSYQEGKIEYPLTNLESGLHNITIKAWDVYNNSSKGYTEFIVAESAEIALRNVLNYPNPFIDNTSFWFEHNKAGDQLLVTIQIVTLAGKVVKTIQEEFIAEGSRVDHLTWDGLDDFGSTIGRGVYIYKVSVKASDNSKAHKVEKLVILK